MRRVLGVLAVLGGVAVAAWWLTRGPSPEQILAAIDVPPARPLTPEEEHASFRVAPGTRVELVAAEPLVVAPVAVAWDDAGRLYVVEMRAFMPNLDGEGEDAPVGTLAVLEDRDADGRYDTRTVFLDGLVLPRAVAVLPEGVLVGVPGDLLRCPPFDEAPRCEAPERITHYAVGRHDPEHAENGLLPGLDGWIYNAKSERRFRFAGGAWQEERTAFRGQWGIAQDDEGRLYANHNSAFLFVDLFPAEYLVRHPGTDPKRSRLGVAVPLAAGAEVHGIRVAPGTNRAYLDDTLRADGRLQSPTAVSGLAVNRADRFGPEARGDVFVPEAAGNVVARFRVSIDGLTARAEQLLSEDAEWGEREFLASTDERFRPVNVAFGPDGALAVVDMYRGVIQHANYVSDHLRAYAEKQGLERPLDRGRIWRVVPEGTDDRAVPDVSRLATPERVALLDDPNGWLRDRAQAWLVHDRDPAAPALLRDLARFGPRGRVHALFALDGLRALDDPTWQQGLADPEPAVRRAALRAGDRRLADDPSPERLAAVQARLEDGDRAVRLQALHSLGEAPVPKRPLAVLVGAVAATPDDAFVRQAVLSGLTGLEAAAIDASLEAMPDERDAHVAWLEELAGAAVLGAAADGRSLASLLDRLHALDDDDWRKLALARGASAMLRRPGAARFELAGPHPLLDPDALAPGTDLARALRGARRGITWPGDPSPAGARPLTPEEEERRLAGEALYAESCIACHGADGRGQPGLAPSLVGSSWLLDTEGWAIRIVLHGLTGPIRVGDEEWSLAMPGHGHDPRFDDATLAGLLTHVRRAWGNAADPIAPEAVAAVRAAERDTPWRAEELLALDLPHRLDRYAGRYEVPIVGIELRIERRGDRLFMGVSGMGGMAELTTQSDGTFAAADPQGGALVLEFEEEDDGTVTGATLVRGGGERIPWRRL